MSAVLGARGARGRGQPGPGRARRARASPAAALLPAPPPDARAWSSSRSPTGRSRRPSAPTASAASTTSSASSIAAELERAIAAGRPAVTDDPTVLTEAAADRRHRRGDRRGRVRRGRRDRGDRGRQAPRAHQRRARLRRSGPILKVAGRRRRRRADRHGRRPARRDHGPRRRGAAARLPADPGRQHQEPARPPPDAGDAARRSPRRICQRPKMITSFADGTKIAAEMAVVANATGFGVATRGMAGPRAERVEEAPEPVRRRRAARAARSSTTSSAPSRASASSCSATSDDPLTAALHEVLQDGRRAGVHVLPAVPPGPARDRPDRRAGRAVRATPAATPLGAPVTEVIALAKRDLKAGRDPRRHRRLHGLRDARERRRRRAPSDLLPMGLTDGAVLVRDVADGRGADLRRRRSAARTASPSDCGTNRPAGSG